MQFTVQLGRHDATPVLLFSVGTHHLIRFELDLLFLVAGFHIELKWSRLYHEGFKLGRGQQSHVVEAGPITAHAGVSLPQRAPDTKPAPVDV